MKPLLKQWIIAISAPLWIAVTPVFAQDCATPSPDDLYVDKDSSESADSGNGRYRADGGTGPFKTIQKLVDTIAAGQCGWVKAAAAPYYEVGRKSGQPIAGITFTRGGSSEAQRVIVSGYPGQTVVIDQQRAEPSGSWGAAGFYIAGGDYITIRNFEVRNTANSSITFNQGGITTKYAIVENNHLHHSYVTENAGGVRLDFCENCIVRSNNIHHHYRTMPGSTSNIFDSQPYGLNAGVHGFGAGNCTVANNLIYNVDNGVYQKRVSLVGLDAHKIYGNIFVNVITAFQIHQGGGQPPAKNAEFHHNIVHGSGGIYMGLVDTVGQSSGLKVYNNTFVNSPGIGAIANFSNVEIYNNVVAGTSTRFAALSGNPVIFSSENPGSWVNRVTYFDNNLYSGSAQKWILGRYTSASSDYASLAAWKGARSADMTYSTPDSRAVLADPGFVSSALGSTKLLTGSADDYALQSNSSAVGAGRNGENLGAVDGRVKVGLLGRLSPPEPPQNISITVQ